MPFDVSIRITGSIGFDFPQSLTAQIDGIISLPRGPKKPVYLEEYPGGAWIKAISSDHARLTYEGGRADYTLDTTLPRAEGGGVDWQSFGTLLAEDARFTILGGKGDDFLLGGQWGDKLTGGKGDDILGGGDGDDSLFGKAGADLLFGGAGDNRMLGGNGRDILVNGDGTDVMFGGRGNDIFVDIGDGGGRATGGRGADIFVVGITTEMSGNPEGFSAGDSTGRLVITDFGADDLLILNGVQTSMGGNPDGVWTDLKPGATLADWDGSGTDDFQFRDTKRGVEMVWGEEEILLRGVAAKEVMLDQLYFGDDAGDTWTGDAFTAGYSPAGNTLDVTATANTWRWTGGADDGTIVTPWIIIESFASFGAETGL